MRFVYLSFLLFLSYQFSIAQLPHAQPPLFPLSWLENCTNYFAPIWTDYIPEEGRCKARPRKTFLVRGWHLEGFEYELDIYDFQVHEIRTILHFTVSHNEPHQTQFLGYLPAPLDTFRYHFDIHSREYDHYFYFISETPSLVKIAIQQRISSNGRKLLSASYRTQVFKNCSVWKKLNAFLQTADTTCPAKRNSCDRIINFNEIMNPEQLYPNFPRPWIEDCTSHFEQLFEYLFYQHQTQCQPLKTTSIDLPVEETFTFRFPIEGTKTIHHFYRNHHDIQDLLHKHSREYHNEFTYTIKTNADRNREHLFYIVDAAPTLVTLSTAEIIQSPTGERINYKATYYRNCDISTQQQPLIKGLNGYCSNDKNPCHSFKQKEKKAQLPYKEFYLKDRTCNTAVGTDYLTILIPRTLLPHCQESGHRFIASQGKFTHVNTWFMQKWIALEFHADPEYLTTENLL